jgi:8-oxo-dGTP diphosphatase
MVFQTKPEDFKESVEIVGCFLEYEGKYLLLLRQDFKPQGNTWDLPAGRVEKGESIGEAMKRELKEESGYACTDDELKFFKTVFVRYPDSDFVYHMFQIQLREPYEVTIHLDEHKEFAWVSPKESLEMNLIGGQAECTKLFYRLI